MLDRLAPRPGARTRHRRPRGPGCGFGKTSGRGTKGQGHRSAGAETGRHFEGGQMPLVRRIRKYGFRRPDRVACEIVNVGALAGFGDGATVDAEALLARGLVRTGSAPIKLLAEGEAPRNLTVRVQRASASARAKIEAAGGKVEIVE
ncbi:MAG: 50S ribosomal protein L15 [Deltaproteobacteria bacterium]|nr:50S ribosomal protein L15 [Deltaproteobacteria bacterium]